ncbi:hypothetical protein F9278_45140 [Streptomyces phaeolivaceus]|uniref:Lipoprotein n=1 Tax=Streptomyces phaeolivaceus TaxID=2653200 RepID=A0A5P8KGM2_9ACTN|nr:hypothetical protein [Streptomyces phaeolivaceus]QFR02157.1 hypothetical protein F9278_45140 [Streptomyces phaeolivaceus]
MNLTPRTIRRRPGAARAVVLGLCAAGALSLTGCSGDGGTGGAGGTGSTGSTGGAAGGSKPTATVTAAAATATASDTDDKTGAQADATGGAETPADSGPAASKSPASKAKASAGADGGGDDCDHKMPISPDEIAVYRYTPEGGFLSLIVKHGNWGCGTPDSDGAPFETVGKETFIPLDQAADITVTTPIVESTENQPIGVQEFLDWLEANPDSGLVFTYHLGDDGAIDRLDEVFTP